MRCRRGLLIGLLSAGPAVVMAQAPAGSDRLSAPAVVESLAVLQALRNDVVRNYKNPAAWFRQGMIAWALNDRCRHTPPVKQLDCTRTRLLADTALMIAEELDPENPVYVETRMKYLLTSEGSFRREAPYLERILKSGLERLSAAPDSIRRANGYLDVGRLYWLRYDGQAYRDWETTPSWVVIKTVGDWRRDSAKRGDIPVWATRDLHEAVRAHLDGKLVTERKGAFWGEADYLRAQQYYRAAHAQAPAYIRAYRALGALYAERNRWPELLAHAKARNALLPQDGWAWMTRGLAEYRTGDKRNAVTSFDSARKHLGDADRNRIMRLERALSPRERTEFTRDPAAFEPMYWAMADPLWHRDDDDPRLEFLSRVAQAELMWTNDELGLNGVNSDRGQTLIRYGPPDRVASKKISGFVPGTITWEWDYPMGAVVMDRIIRFRTDWFAGDTRIADGQAAEWHNLVEGRIDSIPAQVARFRTASDSIDVFVAARPPIAMIRQANQVVAPVRTDFWVKTMTLAQVSHDSIADDADGLRSFRRRVAPGEYIYRMESFGAASRLAARATSRITAGDDARTGFKARGFGVSDVLLGTSATSRTDNPERWSDVELMPLVGTIASSATLSLVWETYGLTNVNGQAEYDVVVTIAIEGRNRPSFIGARIAGILGLKRDTYPGRVEFKFQRSVPHRSTITENVAIALAGTPPGSYSVSATVYDRATGQAAATTRRVVISGR